MDGVLDGSPLKGVAYMSKQEPVASAAGQCLRHEVEPLISLHLFPSFPARCNLKEKSHSVMLSLIPVILLILSWTYETAASPTANWRILRRADPGSSIILQIGLNVPDVQATLEQVAFDIAEPTHSRFREHLTAVELKDALQAPQASMLRVLGWVSKAGIRIASTRGHVVEASMTIGQAEELLSTSYYVYSDGSREVIRTEAYRIPHRLQEHVRFVTPTTSFPLPRKQLGTVSRTVGRRASSGRGTCGSGDDTTPACIRQIYNINHTAQPNRTTFAVYATEAASYSSSDTRQFLKKYNPSAANANAAFGIVGSGDSSEGWPGIAGAFETHLDTQTALGLAWPASGILYNLGGVFGSNAGVTYDPFVQFLQDLIHNDTVPSVVSFSEGMPEDEMDSNYARSLCSMMAQVGARGVTLLFSSGDNGPHGDQPEGVHAAVFQPYFPASCPFVTSVGGTANMANETAATQQTITGLISKLPYTASGGGFSNLFERPSYQDTAIEPYVSEQIPASYHSKSGFNSLGRGIPDVSAFSTNFPVVWAGIAVPIGGTSASTPLWAAIVTLLNDYEASKGRPPLGFINPWLYSLGDGALKDITTGGNNAGACYLLTGCTLKETLGYNVTAGWDPVTGLGSPVFSALTKALDEEAAERR
ncbi:hypothetical protein LTR36_006707 [Oleoguttula mirabilis]|uniref:Peptidase S53 domain-containing protein n=1 Tax=Oleoguttula mirabilis TaxID=1507867 RepID=A0AAV9JBM3_9PEZI|nr:hypothetical protein LTR36_006707 [Oleoguttula mirabilis]